MALSEVRSPAEVLSELVPVRVSDVVLPAATEVVPEIAIDCTVGASTVKVVLSVLLPYVAEMTEVPALTPVARPGVVGLMVALVVLLNQLDEVVRSTIEPSV